MNGATAEPCTSTIKPPNASKTSTIGSNQNFFRSRMNAQISSTKSPKSILPSELTHHVRRLSRPPSDAIRGYRLIETAVHRVLPEEAHDHTHRGQNSEEHDRKNDPCVDPPQDFSERHPRSMNRTQRPGRDERPREQRDSEPQDQPSRVPAFYDRRPESDGGKDSADA